MSEIALKQPGVEDAVAFAGLSINGFANTPNCGIVFVTLKPFEERKSTERRRGSDRRGAATSSSARSRTRSSRSSRRRRSSGSARSAASSCTSRTAPTSATTRCTPPTQALVGQGVADAGARRACSPASQINVPQLDADVDRVKAKQQGVPLTDVFETLQIYLGSLYVNDFNRFGRTYQVRRAGRRAVPRACRGHRAAQDAQRRGRDGAARRAGRRQGDATGPDRAMRYNGYPRGRHQRRPGARLQLRARREAPMAKLAAETLPNGMSYEWTELTYQQILAGNTAVLGLPACDLPRLPGARRAVRELVAAARDHPDRADGAALPR